MTTPGAVHVTVTTEVGYCPFCQRSRNLRREERHLGGLVRTHIECESCHRTLSSTIGPPAAPAEKEPAPEPEVSPAPAPEAKPKPAARKVAAKKPAAKKPAAKKPAARPTKKSAARKPRS